MAGASLVAAGVFVVALAVARAHPIDARLTTAAIGAVVLAGWLAAAIANVARLRFFSPTAIDAGSGEPGAEDAAIRHGRAIVQNTLEQAALAIPIYIGLAVTFDRSMPLVAAMTGLFSAGRALFWAGYAGGAAARALGFALTFYPSVMGLAITLAILVRRALA